MLIHLGGTTITGASAPFIMVTIGAKQGLQLMLLVNPDVAIPIHFDNYNVMLSPLSDFKTAVDEVGLGDRAATHVSIAVALIVRGRSFVKRVSVGCTGV